MTSTAKPSFATNRPGERVADAINGHLEHLRDWNKEYEVAIATAYFNPGGFGLLADELEQVATVRLLLGAEPDVPEQQLRRLKEAASPSRASRARLNRALEGHLRSLELDRDLLGFELAADASGRRVVDWLRSGKVEVRRLEDGFLHGKAFIVATDNEGVIAGSSNFTYAGLATNIELNLGHYDPHVVGQVVGWFDELWAEAKPFDLASLYGARYEEHSPYLIYLRMLWERYEEELRLEASGSNQPHLHLTSFQRDGMWRAKRILSDRNGVVIADEVGLGKTFLAGELIREAVEERRQRVLLISPATLRDGMWKKFLGTFQLFVETRSFEDLAADKRLNENADGIKLSFHPREYAMVVVDEAHNLRNPSTLRAHALRRLLSGTPPKDLVLLTATPVNNTLWDLYYLLAYFIKNDATFADVGIRSLRDHFANAMAMNPDDLSPNHLFDILDAVAVRRTRSFVKTYYPNDTVRIDGKVTTITFPTPKVEKVSYDLEAILPGFFDRFAHALDSPVAASGDPTVLTLARYAPSRYRKDGDVEAYEVQLSGLLRSGLLKRFESSACAFARTCRKMADSHEAFLELLDTGKVATGEALSDWIATDSDEDNEVEAYMDKYVDLIEDASDFDVDLLRTDVMNDHDLLMAFADQADAVTRQEDPKLDALVEQLTAIAEQAEAEGVGAQDERDKRKVLIFSYFADTVDWIAAHLDDVVATDPRLAAFKGRMTSISGSFGSKEEVLWGFAPQTTDAPEGADDDLYDIVIATDVLSEGVNLQQCRHIINYDLPWNPMRLVQRHGRIDRIGSPHRTVYLRCVFPDAQLDELLGLEERLHRKIAQAAAAVGVTEVLPGSKASEVNFAETREEIERLRQGDTELFERGGSSKGVLSGEEYRQELRKALENPTLAARIKSLPWGSGSGMAVQRQGGSLGYIFCVRVGDHERPLFRYIGMEDPLSPEIVDDTLACLDYARPQQEFETARILDDATYASAFDAWKYALDSIVEQWNRAADPANLIPPVPKTMLRAVEMVRASKPPSMTTEEADRLVESLEAPYPERVVRTIRSAMGIDGTDTERVEAISQCVADLGLEPSPPPEPLPEITGDDVHLMCWLALVPPSTTLTIAEQLGELPLGDKL